LKKLKVQLREEDVARALNVVQMGKDALDKEVEEHSADLKRQLQQMIENKQVKQKAIGAMEQKVKEDQEKLRALGLEYRATFDEVTAAWEGYRKQMQEGGFAAAVSGADAAWEVAVQAAGPMTVPVRKQYMPQQGPWSDKTTLAAAGVEVESSPDDSSIGGLAAEFDAAIAGGSSSVGDGGSVGGAVGGRGGSAGVSQPSDSLNLSLNAGTAPPTVVEAEVVEDDGEGVVGEAAAERFLKEWMQKEVAAAGEEGEGELTEEMLEQALAMGLLGSEGGLGWMMVGEDEEEEEEEAEDGWGKGGVDVIDVEAKHVEEKGVKGPEAAATPAAGLGGAEAGNSSAGAGAGFMEQGSRADGVGSGGEKNRLAGAAAAAAAGAASGAASGAGAAAAAGATAGSMKGDKQLEGKKLGGQTKKALLDLLDSMQEAKQQKQQQQGDVKEAPGDLKQKNAATAAPAAAAATPTNASAADAIPAGAAAGASPTAAAGAGAGAIPAGAAEDAPPGAGAGRSGGGSVAAAAAVDPAAGLDQFMLDPTDFLGSGSTKGADGGNDAHNARWSEDDQEVDLTDGEGPTEDEIAAWVEGLYDEAKKMGISSAEADKMLEKILAMAPEQLAREMAADLGELGQVGAPGEEAEFSNLFEKFMDLKSGREGSDAGGMPYGSSSNSSDAGGSSSSSSSSGNGMDQELFAKMLQDMMAVRTEGGAGATGGAGEAGTGSSSSSSSGVDQEMLKQVLDDLMGSRAGGGAAAVGGLGGSSSSKGSQQSLGDKGSAALVDELMDAAIRARDRVAAAGGLVGGGAAAGAGGGGAAGSGGGSGGGGTGGGSSSSNSSSKSRGRKGRAWGSWAGKRGKSATKWRDSKGVSNSESQGLGGVGVRGDDDDSSVLGL
jgi:hypothetical protein